MFSIVLKKIEIARHSLTPSPRSPAALPCRFYDAARAQHPVGTAAQPVPKKEPAHSVAPRAARTRLVRAYCTRRWRPRRRDAPRSGRHPRGPAPQPASAAWSQPPLCWRLRCCRCCSGASGEGPVWRRAATVTRRLRSTPARDGLGRPVRRAEAAGAAGPGRRPRLRVRRRRLASAPPPPPLLKRRGARTSACGLAYAGCRPPLGGSPGFAPLSHSSLSPGRPQRPPARQRAWRRRRLHLHHTLHVHNDRGLRARAKGQGHRMSGEQGWERRRRGRARARRMTAVALWTSLRSPPARGPGLAPAPAVTAGGVPASRSESQGACFTCRRRRRRPRRR